MDVFVSPLADFGRSQTASLFTVGEILGSIYRFWLAAERACILLACAYAPPNGTGVACFGDSCFGIQLDSGSFLK